MIREEDRAKLIPVSGPYEGRAKKPARPAPKPRDPVDQFILDGVDKALASPGVPERLFGVGSYDGDRQHESIKRGGRVAVQLNLDLQEHLRKVGSDLAVSPDLIKHGQYGEKVRISSVSDGEEVFVVVTYHKDGHHKNRARSKNKAQS